jgi:TPR repeat protein
MKDAWARLHRSLQERSPASSPASSPAAGDDEAQAAPTALDDAYEDFETGTEHLGLWRESHDVHHLDIARHYLKRAQERGESAAYEPLGDIAAAGGRPIEAVRWYRLAEAEGFESAAELEGLRRSVVSMASAGDAEAQCEVGEWFLLGQGVEANAAEARSWFEKSAAAGFPLAKYRLALAYYEGNGVPKDPSIGLLHLKAAAEAGQADAQHKLACDVLEDSAASSSDRRMPRVC